MQSKDDPARNKQTVSLVNSLEWTNPVSGKPDGARTAWPLGDLGKHTEHFPLGQVKQCDATGAICRWGVLSAHRNIQKLRFVPGGVALDVRVVVDVDRHQEMRREGANTAMTLPSDVSALRSSKALTQSLLLEYGKVHNIDFDFGIRYRVCVQRLDAARNYVEQCPIAHI
ncbi:hypothetical protein [Massilia glaciei]|nr:hypothetical protein [Massilia glaciei]